MDQVVDTKEAVEVEVIELTLEQLEQVSGGTAVVLPL